MRAAWVGVVSGGDGQGRLEGDGFSLPGGGEGGDGLFGAVAAFGDLLAVVSARSSPSPTEITGGR